MPSPKNRVVQRVRKIIALFREMQDIGVVLNDTELNHIEVEIKKELKASLAALATAKSEGTFKL